MDATVSSTKTNSDNFWEAPTDTSPPSYPLDKWYNNQGPILSRYPQGPPWHHFQTPLQPGVFVGRSSQPQRPRVVVASSSQPSYVGHSLLACFVLWCCNPLFGLIAFILAVNASGSSDADGGRRLARASIIVSVVGIVVALVIAGTLIGVYVTRLNDSYSYSGSSSNSNSNSGSSKCYYTTSGRQICPYNPALIPLG